VERVRAALAVSDALAVWLTLAVAHARTVIVSGAERDALSETAPTLAVADVDEDSDAGKLLRAEADTLGESVLPYEPVKIVLDDPDGREDRVGDTETLGDIDDDDCIEPESVARTVRVDDSTPLAVAESDDVMLDTARLAAALRDRGGDAEGEELVADDSEARVVSLLALLSCALLVEAGEADALKDDTSLARDEGEVDVETMRLGVENNEALARRLVLASRLALADTLADAGPLGRVDVVGTGEKDGLSVIWLFALMLLLADTLADAVEDTDGAAEFEDLCEIEAVRVAVVPAVDVTAAFEAVWVIVATAGVADRTDDTDGDKVLLRE
jgi:hypothetical protein